MSKVVLYHASKQGINGCIGLKSSEFCDFGNGFYLYTDEARAIRRLESCGGKLYTCTIDTDNLAVKNLIGTPKEWVTTVLRNRITKDYLDKDIDETYDCIIGYDADLLLTLLVLDRDTIEEAVEELNFLDDEFKGIQYCLKSKKSLLELTIESEEDIPARVVETYTTNWANKINNLKGSYGQEFFTLMHLGDVTVSRDVYRKYQVLEEVFILSTVEKIPSIPFIKELFRYISDHKGVVKNTTDWLSARCMFYEIVNHSLFSGYSEENTQVYNGRVMGFIASAYAEALFTKEMTGEEILEKMPPELFLAMPKLFT